MKKALSMILVIALVLGLSAVTALADTYSGEVSGIITNDETGKITGSVTGTYNLTITGQINGFTGHYASFTGEVSGAFSGTITSGLYCKNGYDSMYAVIEIEGTGDIVYILGGFPQSGTPGDFAGRVTSTAPAAVSSLTIESPDTTMQAGSTMQMTAVTDPAGTYEVLWAVWMSGADAKDYAWIDEAGLLHALKAGTVTVIANTLDPALATAIKTITITDPETDVTAAVDPTYTIVIPSAVDFGTLQKDTGIQTKAFPVEAKDVTLESGKSIMVAVDSDFEMNGPAALAYTLYNSAPALIIDEGPFTTFSGGRIETGEVRVDTAGITKAGNYSGTMTFKISYQ